MYVVIIMLVVQDDTRVIKYIHEVDSGGKVNF